MRKNMQLDWPNVKAASLLCNNDFCEHKTGTEAHPTKEQLIQHVTPTVTSCFGDRVGETLAKPLLWAASNPEHAERLSAGWSKRLVVVSTL